MISDQSVSWGLDFSFWYSFLTLVIISERVGAEVVECACVIELPDLKVCVSLPILAISYTPLHSLLALPAWTHIVHTQKYTSAQTLRC